MRKFRWNPSPELRLQQTALTVEHYGIRSWFGTTPPYLNGDEAYQDTLAVAHARFWTVFESEREAVSVYMRNER